MTIALSKEGRTILGVVLHPFHDELYATVLGEATTVNGHPVHVSNIASLEQARLILDYSPRDTLRQHLYTIEWERGIKQMFRIGGSVALNMCLVARGAAEGYLYGRVRNRVKSWDIAAATLLVQGAGGCVLDRQGNPWTPQNHSPLCCVTMPASTWTASSTAIFPCAQWDNDAAGSSLGHQVKTGSSLEHNTCLGCKVGFCPSTNTW